MNRVARFTGPLHTRKTPHAEKRQRPEPGAVFSKRPYLLKTSLKSVPWGSAFT